MNQDKNIQVEQFKNIALDDPFFETLLKDYAEFPDWFASKSEENAYIIKEDDGSIQGFLYLKEEDEAITDITPPLPMDRYLKVGTFKINAHGTKLGERFIKKIFDHALSYDISKIYITSFPEHESLIALLKRFGFENVGEKITENGTENVLLKDLSNVKGQVELDYPLIHLSGRKYLLSVYPKFHTRLFPDSILFRENANIIDDVSHTNSISKIYICKMEGVKDLIRGDALVVYRTSDGQGPAEYRSVATSLCMVEDVKQKEDFTDLNDFLTYCASRSVFSVKELTSFYGNWRNLYVIKMSYNGALHNRLIRQKLINDVGLSRDAYWGFLEISSPQFRHIANLGGFSDSLIID